MPFPERVHRGGLEWTINAPNFSENKTEKVNISTSNTIPLKNFSAEQLRNPIDVENIEHNYINNKTSIEVNLVKPRNAKCISDLEYKEKVPATDLACHEEINYDNFEEDIEENNFEETEQFINTEKLSKNRNNEGNYDKLKYKDIEDENITTDNSGGNKQIPINDENLIKDIKNKEFNDINYEDFEKRKTCEDFENVGQLKVEILFKNVDNKKRYYEDLDEQKIDRNDTEQLLN